MLPDAWTIFRSFRKIAFAIAALLSLAWTVLLSVYLSRIWSHSTALQRAAILSMIGVHFFSAVMLYLMIVVVFKFWLDVARSLFLTAIHAGTTIFYMLLSPEYSCVIFSSQSTCNAARLVILVNAWALVGIFVIYTCVLLAMGHIPRPLPEDMLFPPEKVAEDPNLPLAWTLSVSSTTRSLEADTKEWKSPVYHPPKPYSPPPLPQLHSRRMQGPSTGINGAIDNPRPLPGIHIPPPARNTSVAFTISSSSVPTSRPPSYFSVNGISSNSPPTRPESRDSQYRLTSAFDRPLERQDSLSRATTPLSTALTSETYRSQLSACPRWTTFTADEYEHSRGGQPPGTQGPGLLQTYPDVPARLQPDFMPISRSGTAHSYSRSVPALPYDFPPPPSSAHSAGMSSRSSTPTRSPMVQGLPASPRAHPRAPPATPSARSVRWAYPLTPRDASGLTVTTPNTARRPPIAHVRTTSAPLPSPTGSAIVGLYSQASPGDDAEMPNPFSLPDDSAIRREASLSSLQTSGSEYSTDSAPRNGSGPSSQRLQLVTNAAGDTGR